MKPPFCNTKFLVVLICFIVSYLILTNADDSKNIQTAITALQTTNDMLGEVNEFMEKVEPGKVFSKISKVLGALGPAMLAVSTLLSIVAVYLPQEEESPELKAINSEFEKMNNRLDVITSGIKDIKNFVELSSAKPSYIKCITAIQSNFETLQEAKKEKVKESYDYFLQLYDSSYNLAASNLYNGMTGKLGALGFNLIGLYKNNVKCNPMLISKFCIMGMQFIIKGLTVEGAYLGAHNLTAKAQAKEQIWKQKMETLGKSCSAMIDRCEQDWKIISAQQFRDIYKKELTNNNQEFATKIAKSLNNVVPQRSWLAVAYNDASGSGEHSYSTYYDIDKIWNENDKDVTIFSAPISVTLTGTNFEELKNQVDKQKLKGAAVNDCRHSEWWYIQKNRYHEKDSQVIVNFIREALLVGVVYSIRLDKNPGYAATGNTLYASEQKWQCTTDQYRLLIFV